MPTSSSRVRASPRPSLSEYSMIEKLRKELAIELPNGIPSDLDTDLNLLRWIRGFHGKMDCITKNFSTYVASRRSIGFDVSDFAEKFFDFPIIKPFLPFIASSRLDDRVWLDESNAFLFVERAWCQPKEIVKTMRFSDYLIHCFGYSEFLLQLILRREKAQDPDRGPVSLIVLFDLATVNMMDFVNPLSAQFRLWQTRSDLWQDWFPEMVLKIYVLNPPRLMNILWKMARLFLNEDNLRLIEVVGHSETLLNELPTWFIPAEYGGSFVNTVPPGDDSGVSIRRKITPKDYIKPYEHYRLHGVDRPKSFHHEIRAGDTFVHRFLPSNGHRKLLWDFTSSGDVIFSIYAISTSETRQMVYPNIPLSTIKVPEEGFLEICDNQCYQLHFQNSSAYFTLKIDFCVCSAP